MKLKDFFSYVLVTDETRVRLRRVHYHNSAVSDQIVLDEESFGRELQVINKTMIQPTSLAEQSAQKEFVLL